SYLPFLKVNYAPVFTFRVMPGLIFNRFAKRVGIKVKREKFSSPNSAQARLDDNLKKNNPVGLQVGVFQLPYFPEEYRFHFNAHNMIVYGKEEGSYLISDPVMESVTTLTEKELEKVRFAKGAFAPKGHMYYPIAFPEKLELEGAIVKGIRQTCRDMTAPVPIVGVRAMRWVAKSIRKWPKKIGPKKTNHYLGQIVRMQEEIGTGGGGFRYIYGAFLQEAAKVLNKPVLLECSKEITQIGDEWRDFALDASRIYKNRSGKTDGYNQIADQLDALSDKEEAFFKKLRKAV
ncbi:MAG: BtrH N-terminal domain-containing protein, partial [Bacteroidota bacterium]